MEDQISSMVLIRSLLNYTNIIVFPCVRANGRTCRILLNVQLRHILPFFIGFIETHDGQLACVSYVVKTVFSSIAASSSVTIALKCSRGR